MTDDVEGHIHEKYELHKRLGKGAYGIVLKATDRRTKHVVALKKIFDAFRNQTDAQRTFREIMFLQEFGRHPNIIKLLNIIRANNDRDIYLVFEYMEADLHNVIKKMTILKDIHKQYIMCQLFRAVRFLHSGNVLHRDLKPSNVLLDADCRVKLADFGLARSLSQLDDYPDGNSLPELTEYVATRWYRSPEILLAAKRYTKGVDMWSLGCILGEMLLGRALFPGSSTINQIERIMNTINRPSKVDIEGIGSHYAESVLEKMPQKPKKPLDTLFGQNVNPHALDLINRLLIFSPHKRLNAEQCLVHPYVIQFHNPSEEPSLNYDVTLPLPDHIQLTVDEYRNKLYEMITLKKTNIRRIQHEKIIKPPSTQTINDNVTSTNGAYVNQEKQQISQSRTSTENSRRPVTHHYMQNDNNHVDYNSYIKRPETTHYNNNVNTYYNGNNRYQRNSKKSSSGESTDGYEVKKRNSISSTGRSCEHSDSPVKYLSNSRRYSFDKYDEFSKKNKKAEYKQSNISIPSTESNGTIIRTSTSYNSKLGYGGYPQRTYHNINNVRRSTTGERIAPIAQAECSDTDFESARTPEQKVKPNNGNYVIRGRTASAESGKTKNNKYLIKTKKELQRSHERLNIFAALRPSSKTSNGKYFK